MKTILTHTKLAKSITKNSFRATTYFDLMKKESKKKYESAHASLHLPFDTQQVSQALHAAKQVKDASAMIVVGIGGSNLGTRAIYEALSHQHSQKKLYFAETVDTLQQYYLLKEIEENYLKKQKKVIINIVTKSGTTTETIALASLYIELIKKYFPTNFHQYVYITTNNTSPFTEYAKQHQYTVLPIPEQVGGRYSVFSLVGLFPLAFSGINIKKLTEGAKECISSSFRSPNTLIANTQALAFHYNKSKHIINLFLFSPLLEYIGKWYRQLVGESLGKVTISAGKKVHVGPTPTVAIGSTDLHSMAQLYLGGPKDKFTHFVSVATHKKQLKVINKHIPPYLTMINNKKLSTLMEAILKGTLDAYKSNKLPYAHHILESIDAYELGYFLQFKMLEIILLGHILQVNPFNQPNVEDYKKITRKLLENA